MSPMTLSSSVIHKYTCFHRELSVLILALIQQTHTHLCTFNIHNSCEWLHGQINETTCGSKVMPANEHLEEENPLLEQKVAIIPEISVKYIYILA